MWRKKDHLYIRMIEFGVSKPDGFSNEEFDEWKNKNSLSESEKNLCNYSFPEVFKNPTTRSDQKKSISVEMFFNYIDYVELKEARNNSIIAFGSSLLAIIISLGGFCYAVFGDVKLEKETTINLSKSSIESIVNGINK